MKKILLSALLLGSLAIEANAVTYAYDVASNYTGTYALSTPANYTVGNTSISSNYTRKGKFYLNAGHGGFDSNDRPTDMPLIGERFYESEGNLDRTLHLQKFITQNGGSVKMSRVTNTSSDDLNLTSIATYSSNYGGYFISLHSNAGNASANYHIGLYKGVNSSNSVGGSERMAYWDSYNAYNNGCLSNATYSKPRSMADYDLMGWHYGVLRTNTSPGYLVETWFHDYRPESLRFKSSLYNKFLAWQIAVGCLTAPGGSGSLPGCVVGDVRDKSASCGYTSYATRGRDSYLAVNDVTVTLTNSSGTQVGSCTTGGKSNGVYAFFVPAGTYTLKVSKSGYQTQTHTVTVSNNKATQKDIDFVKGVDKGISVSSGAVAFGQVTAGSTQSKTVTVTGNSLSAGITVANSDNTNFTVSPASLGTTGGTLTITYKPAAGGSHSSTVTLTSGSYKATITVTGSAKNPPLTFSEGWNYSETSGKKASWMANWTNYRNMAFGDGKLYVVDAANGVVKVIKAQTAEHIKDLNMTGVDGGALKLVDVAYVGGKIVGTNIATKNDDTSIATLKVYVWDNDDAAPRVLLQTTNIGGMDRVGDAIEIKGDLTTGTICYLGQQSRSYTTASGTTSTGNCNSLITYAITNGVVSTTPEVADIDGFIIGLSPRAIPYGNDYWVAGQNYRASIITSGGELTASVPSTALTALQGNDIVPFTFKGDTYAFATDYDAGTSGDATTMLKNGRATLIAANAGWAESESAGSYPSAGMSTTRNTSMSSSICVNVNGESGVEMWVLIHNQGIAYYKHGTAPTYDYEKVPAITAPAEFTISAVEGNTATGNISVTGSNLTGNITVALSGDQSFSIDKTSLAAAGGDIKVTYSPAAKGSHTATITLTSTGATAKTITLKGTATAASTDPGTSVAKGLTKVWQNTTSVPGTATGGDLRFAGVSNGHLLVNDKANNVILEITETGSSTYYDPSAAITANYGQSLGTAIACDDAGNILVNAGFSGAISGSAFTLISADLKSTYKIDMTAVEGYTAARVDQIGRIRGNMLSAEGAYAFLTPNAGASVLIVKIVNGAIDTANSQLSNATGLTNTTSFIAQPAFETVAEIDALMDENGDLSNSFILRSRVVPGSVYAWDEGVTSMVKAYTFTNTTDEGYTVANASVEGFDWFTLGGKSYFIMPMTTDGTIATRGSIFGVFDQDGTIVAYWSEGEKTGLGACMGSFIVVPIDEYSVEIYHFVPGTVAEKFTFAIDRPGTGVENVIENADAPVEYYNLQGVKVVNPSNGIFIKVQGNKVTKEYIR